jgi:hypothetical protein
LSLICALRCGHNSPAPTLDEFGSTRFLRTFGKPKEFEGSTPFSARNRKKNSPMFDFQKRGLRRSTKPRAQDFDSMSDSQFCDIRPEASKRRNYFTEQIKSDMSDSAPIQSPAPHMWHNPFRARRLFCAVIQGSPSGRRTEQTKLHRGGARRAPTYDDPHFCEST